MTVVLFTEEVLLFPSKPPLLSAVFVYFIYSSTAPLQAFF